MIWGRVLGCVMIALAVSSLIAGWAESFFSPVTLLTIRVDGADAGVSNGVPSYYGFMHVSFRRGDLGLFYADSFKEDPGIPSLVINTSYTLATSVIIALIGIVLLRRRPILPRGHCKTCGYDLRASLDRCPECGTPVPRGSEAKA